MSVNYFDLSTQAKKEINSNRSNQKPAHFGGVAENTTTVETTTQAPAAEEEIAEVPEYPLNQD